MCQASGSQAVPLRRFRPTPEHLILPVIRQLAPGAPPARLIICATRPSRARIDFNRPSAPSPTRSAPTFLATWPTRRPGRAGCTPAPFPLPCVPDHHPQDPAVGPQRRLDPHQRRRLRRQFDKSGVLSRQPRGAAGACGGRQGGALSERPLQPRLPGSPSQQVGPTPRPWRALIERACGSSSPVAPINHPGSDRLRFVGLTARWLTADDDVNINRNKKHRVPF